VAGIRQDCPREDLLGRTIIVVANLAPASLRGVESQGMLLAVRTAGGVRPLTVAGDAAPGLRVT
jgi:methionyl-tRNA synthetase